MTIPYRKALAGVAALSLLAIVVWCFRGSEKTLSEGLPDHEAAMVPAKKPAQAPATEGSRAMAPVHPERSRNWHSVARQTHLQLVSESLTVHQKVIELLGLNLTQAQELNEILASFLERLRSEELAHAYVSVTPGGEEEIVVPGFPAFDRTDILSRFRDEVASKLGTDIGDFIAEEMSWDSTLAVGNFELRLRLERGDDALDRLVVTREVRAPEHWDSVTPEGIKINHGATVQMTATSILQLGIDPRYAHLLSAAETLPRRPETAGLKSSN